MWRQPRVLLFLRIFSRGLADKRVSQLVGEVAVLPTLLFIIYQPFLSPLGSPILSADSSSFKRLIKLPLSFMFKMLVSVSWGSSKKDRLCSYFLLIFFREEPGVLVEATDNAGAGWHEEWKFYGIACKLIGGIFIGDYSEYFFGSERRYDLRIGLQFSVLPACSTPWSCCGRQLPSATLALLMPVLFYPFLLKRPYPPLAILSAAEESCQPLALTIFSTPSILDCSCWIELANFMITGEVGVLRSACILSAWRCASLACFWWRVQKLQVFLMSEWETL